MSRHLAIVFNRPALGALAYRIGSYREFRRHLVDGLAASEHPALARLTTRDPSDFTLALIDAWACALDVVTFYQERTADESYLRTAKEFVSVRELARQIGYVPGPGLAAGAHLAVTLDDSPGAPERVQVEPDFSVISVPDPGRPPVTFEAVESLELRPALNALPSLRTSPHHTFTGELALAGTATNLHPGDFLVLTEAFSVEKGVLRFSVPDTAGPSAVDVRLVRLDTVTVDKQAGLTRVTWSGFGVRPRSGRVFAFRPTVAADARLDKGALVPRFAATFANLNPNTTPLAVVTDGTRHDLYPGLAAKQLPASASRPPLSSFREADLRVHYDFVQVPVAAVPAPLTVRDELHLGAPAPNLVDGDGLLVTDGAGERWLFASVGAVRRDLARNTWVVTPRWIAGSQARPIPGDDLRVFALRQRSPLFGHNAPSPNQVPLTYEGDDFARKFGDIVKPGVQVPGILAPVEFRPITFQDWIGRETQADHVQLAQSSPQLQPGATFLLVDDGRVSRFVARDVRTLRDQRFFLDALCTRLLVADDPAQAGELLVRTPAAFALTTTVAWFAPDPLTLAEAPLPPDLAGDEILVQGAVQGLLPGRTLIVTGQDDRGRPAVDLVRLELATPGAGFTRLRLTTALPRTYRRDSVQVLANVVRATHGETVTEVLGSGDATRPFQRFPLQSAPLTFVSAATATGRRSTLEVRVGGLLWREVDSLHTFGPADRVYLLLTDQTGRTLVQFGDGVHGARLPSGAANVRATYRKGTGLEGQVRADSLTLPVRKPTGVKAVRNPLAAGGGADPERLEDARRNATRTVIALDRVVSLRDYEDFARAFAGVAKAQATRADGGGVAVTVAGPGGAPILPNTDLYDNLRAALRAAGDPSVPVVLKQFELVLFHLAGTVRRAPDVLADDLHRAVDAALHARFSFDARDFAEPVYFSEVIAAIQAVPGVLAVDLDRFVRDGDDGPDIRDRLVARRLHRENGKELLTELLVLDPDPLTALAVVP